MSRARAAEGAFDRFLASTGEPRATAPEATCACGEALVWARVLGTFDSIPLALGVGGEPKTVRRGDYTIVASQPDALGRRPLVVEPVDDRRGALVDHRRSCPATTAATA